MAYCTNCGSALGDVKFCGECGTAVPTKAKKSAKTGKSDSTAATESTNSVESAAEDSAETTPESAPVVDREPATPANRNLAMWAHLSGMLTLVVGLMLSMTGLGIILAMLAWLLPLLIKNSANANEFVKDHAARSVNFQVQWLIIGIVAGIFGTVFSIVTFGLGLFLAVPFGFALVIFQIVIATLAGIAANRGERYAYPLQFIRVVR